MKSDEKYKNVIIPPARDEKYKDVVVPPTRTATSTAGNSISNEQEKTGCCLELFVMMLASVAILSFAIGEGVSYLCNI